MSTNLNVRVDSKVKEQAESILESLGMNLTTAINVYLRQIIRENGIPFEIKGDIPNKETIAAIKEGDELSKNPASRSFKSTDELRKALDL